jgi:hypothetical protein
VDVGEVVGLFQGVDVVAAVASTVFAVVITVGVPVTTVVLMFLIILILT